MTKDWLSKNGKKIKEAYSMAIERNYDIYSIDDVLKILKEVDPEKATKKNAYLFAKMLKLFDLMVQKKKMAQKTTKSRTVN